jgi:hypothetical protein
MNSRYCWLWPDKEISKSESRQLREEHNEIVNKLYKALNDLFRACAEHVNSVDDEAAYDDAFDAAIEVLDNNPPPPQQGD